MTTLARGTLLRGPLGVWIKPASQKINASRLDETMFFFWPGEFEPRLEIESARLVDVKWPLLQILITPPIQNAYF